MEVKTKYIFVSLILVIVVLSGFIVYTKSYYPEVPFEGASKRETVNQLNQSHDELILLKEDENKNWYGFNGNPSDGSEALILFLQKQGYTFDEQIGSGYFFSDHEGYRLIVESQMWTSKYVLFEIPN